MNLILIMVREKMDVDPISRKEKIKESFFPDYDDANSCQLTFARQDNIKDRKQVLGSSKVQNALEKQFKVDLKRNADERPRSSKKLVKGKSVLTNQLQKKMSKEVIEKLCHYDIDRDDGGFGQWLAYQLCF